MAANQIDIAFVGKDQASATIKGLESSLIRFVGAVASAFAALKAVTFPVKVAAEFQREMLNVQKTTDFTQAELAALGNEFRALSEKVDVTAADLAKIGAAAGQLGLKGSIAEVAAFADSVSRLSSVLDIDVTLAAEGVAKLQNIFKLRLAETEKVGSLLNELSNNSTLNGQDAFDIIQRIGTAGNTLTLKQSAALAAYGKDLGLTNEVIGTSFNKIFLDLLAKADDIATAMGIPIDEWSRKVRVDGIGALKAYIDFLSKLPAAQQAAFAEQTTGGGRIFALITNILNDQKTGYSLLNKELQNAAVGFDEGTSAIREQETVLGGFLKQLKVLGNVFSNLFEKEGEKALSFLTEYVKRMQEAFKDERVVAGVREFMGSIGDAAKKLLELATNAGKVLDILVRYAPAIEILLKLLLLKTAFNTVSGIVGSLFGKIQQITATTAAWVGTLGGSPAVLQRAATAMSGVNQQIARATSAGMAPLAAQLQQSVPLVTRLGTAFHNLQSSTKVFNDIKAAQQRVIESTQNMTRRIAQLQAQGASPAQIAASQQFYRTQIQNNQNLIQQIVARANAEGGAAKASASAATSTTTGLLNVSRAQAGVIGRLGTLGTAFSALAGVGVAAGATIANAMKSAGSSVTGVWQNFKAAPLAALAGLGGKLLTGLGIGLLAVELADMLGLLDPIIEGVKSLFNYGDTTTYENMRKLNSELETMREREAKITAAGSQFDKLLDRDKNKPIVVLDPNQPGYATALAEQLERASEYLTASEAKAHDLSLSIGRTDNAALAASEQFAILNNEITRVEEELKKAGAAAKYIDSPLSPESNSSAVQERKAAAVTKTIELERRLTDLITKRGEIERIIQAVQERSQSLATSMVAVENARAESVKQLAGYYDSGAVALAKLKQEQLKAKDAAEAQARVVEDLQSKLRSGQINPTEGLMRVEREIAQLNLLKAAAEKTANDFKTAFGNASIASAHSYELFFRRAEASGAETFSRLINRVQALAGVSTQELDAQIAKASTRAKELGAQLTVLYQKRQTFLSKGDDGSEAFKALQGEIRSTEALLNANLGDLAFFKSIRQATAQAGASFDSNIIPAAKRAEFVLTNFFSLASKTIMMEGATRAVRELKTGIDALASEAKNKFERLFTDLANMAEKTREIYRDIARGGVQQQEAVQSKTIDSKYDKEIQDLERLFDDRRRVISEGFQREQEVYSRDIENRKKNSQINDDQAQRETDSLRRRMEEKQLAEERALAKSQEIARRRIENARAEAQVLNQVAGKDKAIDFEVAQMDEVAKRYREVKAELERLNATKASSPEDLQKTRDLQLELNQLVERYKAAADAAQNLAKEQAQIKNSAIVNPLVPGGEAKALFDPSKTLADAMARIDGIAKQSRQVYGEMVTDANKSAQALVTQASGILQTHEKNLMEVTARLKEAGAVLGVEGEQLDKFLSAMKANDPVLSAFAERMEQLSTADFAQAKDNIRAVVGELNNIDSNAEKVAKSFMTKLLAGVKGDASNVTKPLFDAFTQDFKPSVAVQIDAPKHVAQFKAEAEAASAKTPTEVTVMASPDGMSRMISNIQSQLAAASAQGMFQVGVKGNVITGNKAGGLIGAAASGLSSLGAGVASLLSRGIQGFATGGSVRGAGTGTSDSILSWLSHGEYVMDAMTVRKFGSSFFRWLQTLARDSSFSLSSLSLPAFAGGGSVGDLKSISQSAGSAAALAPVNLYINDQPAGQFLGTTDSVGQLVNALRKSKRVTAR